MAKNATSNAVHYGLKNTRRWLAGAFNDWRWCIYWWKWNRPITHVMFHEVNSPTLRDNVTTSNDTTIYSTTPPFSTTPTRIFAKNLLDRYPIITAPPTAKNNAQLIQYQHLIILKNAVMGTDGRFQMKFYENFFLKFYKKSK